MVTSGNIRGYFVMMGDISTRNFLDMLGEDGIYTLYWTGMYKELELEHLFGMYHVLLMNIKLHEDLEKTGVKEVENIEIQDKRNNPYICKVTVKENVLSKGKEYWYDFITLLTKRVADYHKKLGFMGVVPEDHRRKRGMVWDKDLDKDILMYVLTFRDKINRRKGQESVRLMIRVYTEELLEFYRKDKDSGEDIYGLLLLFLHGAENYQPWNKLITVNGKLTTRDYGLTKGDTSEVKELRQKVKSEIFNQKIRI